MQVGLSFFVRRVPSGSVNVCSNFLFRIFLSCFLYIYVRVPNLLNFSQTCCSFLSGFKESSRVAWSMWERDHQNHLRIWCYVHNRPSTISSSELFPENCKKMYGEFPPLFPDKRGMIDPLNRLIGLVKITGNVRPNYPSLLYLFYYLFNLLSSEDAYITALHPLRVRYCVSPGRSDKFIRFLNLWRFLCWYCFNSSPNGS